MREMLGSRASSPIIYPAASNYEHSGHVGPSTFALKDPSCLIYGHNVLL